MKFFVNFVKYVVQGQQHKVQMNFIQIIRSIKAMSGILLKQVSWVFFLFVSPAKHKTNSYFTFKSGFQLSRPGKKESFVWWYIY